MVTVSFTVKPVTLNGPVPTGMLLASVQVGAAAPRQASNCAFCNTGDSALTKAV
jgi:hypothetical protein